jgi:hypothetical protein
MSKRSLQVQNDNVVWKHAKLYSAHLSFFLFASSCNPLSSYLLPALVHAKFSFSPVSPCVHDLACSWGFFS